MLQNSKPAVQLSLSQLEEIKKNLIKRREELKKELETRYPAAYKWLIDRNIDLDNLQKYSKNIAAALAFTSHLLLNNPSLIPVPTPMQMMKTKDDLPAGWEKMTEEEKAKRVWQLYGDAIKRTAQKYEIDPQLIFATIMTESEGNPRAYRYEPHIDDASYGLGQILYTTAISLGFEGKPEELYKPEVAIEMIGRYHKNTLETYGPLSAEQMTVVYNCGTLFGAPTYGHLDRFCEWYYTYSGKQFNIIG